MVARERRSARTWPRRGRLFQQSQKAAEGKLKSRVDGRTDGESRSHRKGAFGRASRVVVGRHGDASCRKRTPTDRHRRGLAGSPGERRKDARATHFSPNENHHRPLSLQHDRLCPPGAQRERHGCLGPVRHPHGRCLPRVSDSLSWPVLKRTDRVSTTTTTE